MYIQVRLFNGFKKILIYSIPETWAKKPCRGSMVSVPLKHHRVLALVEEILQEKPAQATFAIKSAYALEEFPADHNYAQYIDELSNYYQLDPIILLKRVQHFIGQEEIVEPLQKKQEFIKKEITLTTEQQTVVNFLLPVLKKPCYTPTLLHGVTGSGKTEVYKKLIEAAIAQQKTVLLLLPEVTLALQFETLLRNSLSVGVELFSFHSATNIKQKRLLWQKLLQGKPVLIIGVHLPVLVPIANLGLIIVDEEHEVGYQEKKHPKINTKEAALLRASICKIPILLGSATPSISSLYNVKTKGWYFFTLKQRFTGAFPTVNVINLRVKKPRRNFWISKELEIALTQQLQKKEQTIIFLNRRGYSFFIQCKGCGYIATCKHCSISLTLHDQRKLECHYCGFAQQLPTQCPQCKSPEENFIKKGIGTQQVVSILQEMFPQARIARADLDISARKKIWHKIIEDFSSGVIDVLVGTQTITKGYHFPNVTLVGILWADINLNFPVYNACETTLQQLIQVAGRAGRQKKESLVIVQTMAEHQITNFLNELQYSKFYTHEIEQRETVGYPPCIRIAEIELKHTDETIVNQEAKKLVQFFLQINTRQIAILGPAKPPVNKIKNSYRQKIYLKGININNIIDLYRHINQLKLKSSVYFTPNPLH